MTRDRPKSSAAWSETHGFVVNLAKLFETVITRMLDEHVGGLHPQLTMKLDKAERLTIKPDPIRQDELGTAIAVADRKYKLLDEDGTFPNAGAYQLVTYCARLGLDTGHLIYAAGDPQPEPYDIEGTGVRLVVHAIDIGVPVPDLETQVEKLAERLLPVVAANS